MKTFKFGETSGGRTILAHSFGTSGPKVLILGGVHGNEPEGYTLANELVASFLEDGNCAMRLTIVPALNLDGLLLNQRTNGRGVDLNRNLPTKDWQSQLLNPKYPPGPFPASEPENKALLLWLEQNEPQMIYSLHSWKPLLNVNGNCRAEAETLSQILKYPIEEDIGYPTPGCLGTYCGLERNMPTLTYEIERGLSNQQIKDVHLPAMREALKVSEQRKL